MLVGLLFALLPALFHGESSSRRYGVISWCSPSPPPSHAVAGGSSTAPAKGAADLCGRCCCARPLVLVRGTSKADALGVARLRGRGQRPGTDGAFSGVRGRCV